MIKWFITIAVVAAGVAGMWHFRILQAIGGAFKAWLDWIGA